MRQGYVRLLGLNLECMKQASASDKFIFRTVFSFFCMISLATLSGTFVIGMVVTHSRSLAVPLMLICSYIMLNLFWFSLNLVQPAIHFYEPTDLNSPSPVEVPQGTVQQKRMQRLRAFGKKLWGFFPTLSGMVRFVYLSLFSIVLAFPLAALVNWEVCSEGKAVSNLTMVRVFTLAAATPSFPIVWAALCAGLFGPHRALARVFKNPNSPYNQAFQTSIKAAIRKSVEQFEQDALNATKRWRRANEELIRAYITSCNPFLQKQVGMNKSTLTWAQFHALRVEKERTA